MEKNYGLFNFTGRLSVDSEILELQKELDVLK